MTQKTNGTASGSAEGIYWYRDGCKNGTSSHMGYIWLWLQYLQSKDCFHVQKV